MALHTTQFKTQLNETSPSDIEGIGEIRFELPNKVYKWVRYIDDAVAAVVGMAVYYWAAGYESGIVTSDVSDSYGASGAKAIQAGVLKSAPLTSNYCWVQIMGGTTILTNAAAGAAGDSMTGIGSNDKGVDVSALVIDNETAIMTSTTTGVQDYILRCPF